MMPTLTTRRTWRFHAIATDRDGFHGATTWPVTITAVSQPNVDRDGGDQLVAEPADFDSLGEWIDLYLDGKDLTGVLDFAPTTDQLARYMATVCHARTPGFATVTVTFPQTGESTTAALTA